MALDVVAKAHSLESIRAPSSFACRHFVSSGSNLLFLPSVNWVDHSKTLREQGVDEAEILLLRRKYFYSDANVDARYGDSLLSIRSSIKILEKEKKYHCSVAQKVYLKNCSGTLCNLTCYTSRLRKLSWKELTRFLWRQLSSLQHCKYRFSLGTIKKINTSLGCLQSK